MIFSSESLTELLAREKLAEVDLLKMDCDGGEYGILERSSNENLRRLKWIMKEFHVYQPSHCLRMLVGDLKSSGFAVHTSKPWMHDLLRKTSMFWAAHY